MQLQFSLYCLDVFTYTALLPSILLQKMPSTGLQTSSYLHCKQWQQRTSSLGCLCSRRFVVKTTDEHGGKVFVNICHSKEVSLVV